MTLIFSGDIGIGAEASLVTSASYSTSPAADSYMIGGTFTVNATTVIRRVYWMNPADSPNMPAMPFAIWDITADPNRDPLLRGNFDTHNPAGAINGHRIFATSVFAPLLLQPGTNYVFGCFVARGQYMNATAPLVGGASSGSVSGVSSSTFVWNQSVFTTSSDDLEIPNVGTVPQSWAINLKFDTLVYLTVTQDIPPDPIIFPGGHQFSIGIKRSWFPGSIIEWTLQYSSSPDGAGRWGEWTEIGTYPITGNIQVHGPLDPFDKPFYRYRYKVASVGEQSPWSEYTYTGQVSSALVTEADSEMLDPATIPAGSIGAGLINVSQLSSVTADIGTLTAGVMRGPLIETSASNPRVYMQQDVGLQATDAGGGNVFSLDALTGALTLKGAITTGSSITGTTVTGGTVQTGTTGARVIMSSAGLTAYKTDGTTKTLEFKISDGSLALSGALTTNSGSSLDGQYITASTVTAGKLNVTTLSAITADLGTITAGTVTGATVRTAASGSRVSMTSAGIVGYASDGTTERFKLDTTTGLLTLNGAISTASGSIIDGQYIAASTITTAKLSATAIDGMTITGATVRTASSGSRVQMDTTTFGTFNASNALQLSITGANGLLFSGSSSFASPQTVSWRDADGIYNAAEIGSYSDTSGATDSTWLQTAVYGGPSSGPGGFASIDMNTYDQRGGTWGAGMSIATPTPSLASIEGIAGAYYFILMNQAGGSTFANYKGATTTFSFTSPWANFGSIYQHLTVFTLATVDGNLVCVQGLIKSTGNVTNGNNIATGFPVPISGTSVVITGRGQVSSVYQDFWAEITSSGNMLYSGASSVTWGFVPINFVYMAAV